MAVAHHEAGHCVVALAFDHVVELATLFEAGHDAERRWGVCRSNRNDDSRCAGADQSPLRACEIWRIMDQFTGVQEVLQDYPVKVWTYSDDLACRRNILEKRLRAITRMLVRCHRLRIEVVARTLDRGSLNVEELDALMQCGNPDAILASFGEHGCARS
jgi:hypothetical protein